MTVSYQHLIIYQNFQNHSSRDRKFGLSQGIEYLNYQLIGLKKDASESMKTAQSYALDNGLGLQDGMLTSSISSTRGESVEAKRETAQNEVNALRKKLKSVSMLGYKNIFQAPQLQANTSLYSDLQKIESRLQSKRTILKPNDPLIRKLERENLI